ncbi:hypothetical protein OE88DRAFT_1107527 [Heliocybe sulcata]|uniref:Uncharacterized protein n=1 Tax=Heliocybe sulcata TaxID=5364 RepID=A0A5C3MJM6_9AGAM|nr:hypothetical protein OE88DRAFT_1107527 [Heliocybe sulcata]
MMCLARHQTAASYVSSPVCRPFLSFYYWMITFRPVPSLARRRRHFILPFLSLILWVVYRTTRRPAAPAAPFVPAATLMSTAPSDPVGPVQRTLSHSTLVTGTFQGLLPC